MGGAVVGGFTWLEALVVLAAGIAAGAINSVVGSGSLVSFPTLVAVGLPPVTANVSNTLGLVPGAGAAVWHYRTELRALRTLTRTLVPASITGALVGSWLLLAFPSTVFEAVVPVLVAAAVVLVLTQPLVAAAVARRAAAARPDDATSDEVTADSTGADAAPASAGSTPRAGVATIVAVGLAGVYGAYFGAAQGVILLGILGFTLAGALQQANAVKNALAGMANLVAGVIFAVLAPVDWWAVLLVAVGALVGGSAGARLARRLPPAVFRAVITIVGIVALIAVLT
jgi:hypothetical protein